VEDQGSHDGPPPRSEAPPRPPRVFSWLVMPEIHQAPVAVNLLSQGGAVVPHRRASVPSHVRQSNGKEWRIAGVY
jgi:hypothetical protein